MKVSIIIPAFNAARWIRDAVDSVRAQDFKDWELIVVDDGSTDETCAIVDGIASADGRVSVVHQQNAGPGVARNSGIDHSRGDYLLFLDSDDQLASPSILSSMVQRAGESGCDVLLARARKIGLHGELGSELAWCLRKDLLPTRDVFSPEDVGASLFFAAGPVPWGKFYRRELVEREKLRFPSLSRSEDFPFVQTALACSGKIAVYDGVMVLHRTGRMDSLENTKDATPLIFAEAEQIFFKMLEERGIWQKFSLAAKARALLRLTYNVENMHSGEAVEGVVAQLERLLDRYRLPAGFCGVPDVAGVRARIDAVLQRYKSGSPRSFCGIISAMPKVSVIIPVYNVEAYLRRCLDSVVGQTLRDMEIICVDDGSTDGSTEILREYAAKDSRVKVLQHEHTNAGAARNAGMAVAAGEYLGFVDSDDWCEPTLFEKAYGRAKADDADVVLWGFREREEPGGDVRREVTATLPRGVCAPCTGADLQDKVFSCFNYAPWNRLVRADFVRRNRLEFQQLERSNDVAFGCLALAAASRISVVDGLPYNYAVRSAGNLQTDNHRTPLSIVEAWSFLVKELARRGLVEKYRAGVALASMYCFVRTLDVLSEHEREYATLFAALKALFERDEFFSTVQPEEISNDIMANALKMIRESDSFAAFAIRQASDVNKWMGKFYREREMFRGELADVKKENEEFKERLRLPGVSLVVVSDGDGRSRQMFGEEAEKSSVADREIIYVNGVSKEMLDGVGKDYVAIVRDNCRYVDDYALEVLVNTAKYEHADIVGGVRDGASANVADFVFRTAWLRAHGEFLDLLEVDEQAFVAAVLARAGKQIVRNRVYVECLAPTAEPLVSVVVPAYNAERCLDRCLKSLVDQTHRNLEIIVVDDGSTDSTGGLCDAWAAKDGRVRVIHKPNGGLSSARNAGMRVAKGKYVGFVDSDDYVDAEMFGDLAKALEEHPKSDVAKCGVSVEYTYKVSEAELKSTQAYFKEPACGEVRPECDVVNATDVCAVDKLYRADFLRKNGIVFPEGVKNEDEAFFFAVCCRMRHCCYLPQSRYHYLRNEDGIMAKQKKAADAGELPDALKVYEFVAELLERENRRDLLGVLYRHMVGFVQRFVGTPVEDAICDGVSAILHKTQAFYYADLVCGGERQWVRRRVYELMNRAEPRSMPHAEVPDAWFPSVPPPERRLPAPPLVSFIMPVYNAEKYVAGALETLRRQTLPYFEVICIDDGSIDDSGRILDFYARIDPRIKVWHLENGGVSRARNFGIEKATGRYVAFVDGDDRLRPEMAALTVLTAARHSLEALMFDYRCFDYDTLKAIGHYWQLANHVRDFPSDRTFSPAELEQLSVYGSSCTFLWNRGFLNAAGETFPGIKLGEDLVWVLSVLSKVRRMRVLNEPFYEYRRGNPSSAVSRLQNGASEAPVLALKGLAAVLDKVNDERLRMALLRRMIADVLFYGEQMPKARGWLQDEGFRAFGGIEYLTSVCSDRVAQIEALAKKDVSESSVDIEYFIRQTPRRIRKIMRQAINDRKDTVKDLVIVAGQLNSTANEPIDSWTFFRWLQDHGCPCRYVVWRKHCMIERMRADNGLKDVILLSGNGVDNFEFIEKCRALLPRLKAVVMENTALNPLTWRYFHMLEGCSYIFLQHGPTFWKMAPKHISAFAVANYVNVASESEKEFLEVHVPAHWETGRRPQYLIAGLPRWDLLKDESGTEREKVIFYMPTWRAAFNGGMDIISKSAYFSGVRALVSGANLDRLRKRNLRLVMAAHHHLVNHVKNLDFALPIELVPSSEISYWIRHASLCVTDYSSVSFDFLFLNKPCVFWTPDRHDGLLTADDYAEVIFAEHQAANMFNRVHSVEDVVAMIEKYADSEFRLEPEKCAVANRYFACRGNVCARLYEQICAVDGEALQ